MSIKRSVRKQVLERDDYVCQYCGKSPKYLYEESWNGNLRTTLHIDHIAPKSKGGQDVIENLVTACVSCNLKKKDKLWQAPIAHCVVCGWLERSPQSGYLTPDGPIFMCENCKDFQEEVDAWDNLAVAVGC